MPHRTATCLGLALCLVVMAPAQTAHGPAFGATPNATIPPSGTGGGACGGTSNTFDTHATAAFAGLVGSLVITVDIDHSYAGDVVMTLIHDGVSVVLSDGNNFASGGGADLHGGYSFSDAAPTAFDAAPLAPGGRLAAGTYRPDNPLSAFTGAAVAGIWTLRICDRAAGDVGVLHSTFLDVRTLGTQVSDPIVQAPIPPSGTGGGSCGAPPNTFTHVVNVVQTGRVGDVATYFDITHSASGDLTITLSHMGVTRTIFSPAIATGALDFNGFYSFWENRFSPISGANATSGALNTGYYRSLQDFAPFHGMEMSGPWYLTICDGGPFDVGVLHGFVLSIARQGFSLSIEQPTGSASLDAVDRHGAATGNAYFNVVTLNAGNYPNGWFYGIDIGYSDLLFQLDLPIPFFHGTLDASVQAASSLPGPIPAGIHAFATAIEFENGSLRQASAPSQYTTLP